MLKFRWSLRCWETLQGKNDSRPLLEEAAAAIHHLGFIPMPPDSPLRLVYEELVSRGRTGDSVPLHSAAGGNPAPGASDATRVHSGGLTESLLHAASLGVPPVAAGVLRDLHREGNLNGEVVSNWGDVGIANPDLRRALNVSAAGTDPGALALATTDGGASTSTASGGGSIPTTWVSPPALPAGSGNGKRKVGVAFPDAALLGADTDW